MKDIKVDTTVMYQGLRMKVVDAPYNGMITLMDLHDTSVLCQAAIKEVSLAPHTLQPLATIDAVEWEMLDSMANAARTIINAKTLAERRQHYERCTLELACSKRTLQRVVKRLKCTNSVIALRAGPSGRPVGLRLLQLEVEAIIYQQLTEKWLVANRPLLAQIADQIQSECRSKHLAEPCKATIRKRAAALDNYRTLALREGSKKARYTLKALVGHIEAASPLQIVQIDHTLADVMLVSEFNRAIPIGRPWVSLAIDVATRMVVGVYLTLEAPSAVSVAMCLVNAMSCKEGFITSLGLSGRWPVSGVMACIHLDNGRDFHSEALQRGCSELGIDIQYRPVGSPHYGGIIERLIGTLMGRCRLLPGATQSNVANRGDYDAEFNAVMTLTEFKAFFVNEIINTYHTKEHGTLGVPPLVKWDELQSGDSTERPLPAGSEHWMLQTLFYPFEMRLIRRTGIQLFNRDYWADGLEEWIGDGITRAVSYDPGDLSKVIIQGPNGVPLVAHDTRTANRLSLAERHLERKQQQLLGHNPAILAQLDHGLDTRQDLIAKATKATKAAHRQAAIAKGKRSRSKDVPVQPEASEQYLPSNVIHLNFNPTLILLNVRRKGG